LGLTRIKKGYEPLLSGCPRDDNLLRRVRIDEIDGGKLVDGVVHFADGQTVELELNFNFNLLIFLQLPRVNERVGQPQVECALARVLDDCDVGNPLFIFRSGIFLIRFRHQE